MPLTEIRRQLDRKVRATALNSAREIEQRLRQNSPVDSGEMRNRTTARARVTSTGAEIDVTVDTPYAHIVAHGQRPHTIRPRREGGVLVFQSGGRTVYARSVNHPGAQGNSWWDDTIRDIPDILLRNWRGAR